MSQCVIAAAERVAAVPVVSVAVADVCVDLLELLVGVGDGRSSQGRDHPAAVVLALAAAATVAGMKGYTAIAGWVGDVPVAVVAELYVRVGAAPAGWPSRTTIWRVCTDADAQALDAAIGAWLSSQLAEHTAAGQGGGVDAEGGSAQGAPVHVRLDGKTVRGAKDA